MQASFANPEDPTKRVGGTPPRGEGGGYPQGTQKIGVKKKFTQKKDPKKISRPSAGPKQAGGYSPPGGGVGRPTTDAPGVTDLENKPVSMLLLMKN